MASERESDDVSSPWRIGDDKEVKQVSLRERRENRELTSIQTGRSSLQVTDWKRELVHSLWGQALLLSIPSLSARVHIYLKWIEFPAQWLARLTLQDQWIFLFNVSLQ